MSEKISYSIMRLMVIFDKPVETAEERREYNKFRKFLLKQGFMMLQYSVYVRYCANNTSAEKYINHIKGFGNKYGDVRIILLTENQFANMILISGEKKIREEIETDDELIIF